MHTVQYSSSGINFPKLITGESRKEDEFEPNRQQSANIVHAIKQLKKNHLMDMSAAAVVTISGPEVGKQLIERQEEMQKAVKKLFGLQVNKWEHLPKSIFYKFEGESSTTVDMTVSPPESYKENTKLAINEP